MNLKYTIAIAILSTVTGQSIGGQARVEVVVVSAEDETPIANVPVTASFNNNNGWKAWTEPASINHDTRITDADGRCRLSGKSNNGEVGCWVASNQQGFYGTRGGEKLKFTRQDLFGTWQPDNLVVTIRLQRVENPIPLLVKQFLVDGSDSVKTDLFAKGGGILRLDLLKGEWLPPIGNGKHPDVVFTRFPREHLGIGTNFNGRTATAYRDSMEVRFTGVGNGLVQVTSPETAGLMIRNAPQSGYRQSYLCWKGRTNDLKYAEHFNKKRNFAFRIRTRLDTDGRVLSAYYGKIYGDIDFKKLFGNSVAIAAPSFQYYLNPTPNDHNLEWDMKNNLCPDSQKVKMSGTHNPMLLP